MAFQKTKSGNSYNNNGGVVINAGNVVDKMTDLSLLTNTAMSGVRYGTSVIQDIAVAPFDYTDPHGVTLAKTNGTFAYTPAPGTNFLIMRAGDNAANINGSGSTALYIPAGANGQTMNKNLKSTQLGSYATTKFNLLAVPSSGNFPGLTRGTGFGTAVTYQATSGAYPAIDDAASTSRAVPGELTYRFGAALPTRNVSYKAKDAAESGINL
jgi:hypothetical protein